MKNEVFVLNFLLIVLFDVFMFFTPSIVTIIFSILLSIWVLLPFFYDRFNIAKKIIDGLFKLSFPYTTDEVIILNCMKVVNFFIGKRFQILYAFDMVHEPKCNISDKTIFYEDFSTFKQENWDKTFPWGNGNNTPENVFIVDGKIILQMKKENYRGYWGKERDYINTTGMIYSKKSFPTEATYEARVNFSTIDHINQAFWVIHLEDSDPKIIQEIDFEYHLSENKISMSQHWGNGYTHEENHRSDTFSFDVDLYDYHTLKFVFKKNSIKWYIDNVLVKWHFLGVPKMEHFVILCSGNNGSTPEDIGKLDINELPAFFKCDWIKINENK